MVLSVFAREELGMEMGRAKSRPATCKFKIEANPERYS